MKNKFSEQMEKEFRFRKEFQIGRSKEKIEFQNSLHDPINNYIKEPEGEIGGWGFNEIIEFMKQKRHDKTPTK